MDAVLSNVYNVGSVMRSLIEDLEEETEEKCSMYIKEGENYIPCTKLQIANRLEKGAYKIEWKNNDWCIIPVPINVDELYSFENDATSKILEETQLFWDKKDLYDKYHLTHKRGILLAGMAGTGKTCIINMLSKQVVDQDGLIFVANNAQDFISMSQTLNSIIRQIEPDRPIITVIEDVDQMVKSLNGDSQILDFMDGKTSFNHHLTILTSNDTTDLSAALLRPSRIDMCLEVQPPTENVRREYFRKKGIDEDLIEDYVEKTDDFTFAELKETFIGTKILGKDIDKVVEQITDPFECKDYLNEPTEIKGI